MALPDRHVFYHSIMAIHINYRIEFLNERILPMFNRNLNHSAQLLGLIRQTIGRLRITRTDISNVLDILRRRQESIGRRIHDYNRIVRGSHESLYESSDSDDNIDSETNEDIPPRLYHRQPNSPTFSEATTRLDEHYYDSSSSTTNSSDNDVSEESEE